MQEQFRVKGLGERIKKAEGGRSERSGGLRHRCRVRESIEKERQSIERETERERSGEKEKE